MRHIGMSAKPISRKDLSHFRRLEKEPFCALREKASAMLFSGKWNPRTKEKNEKDDCQDCRGYIFAACFGCDAGSGRHCASAHMLSTALSCAVMSQFGR